MQNIMTLGEMADEVGDLVEDDSAGRRSSIKAALARIYDSAMAEFEYGSLERVDDTGLRSGAPANSGVKTLETGEAEFPLPFHVGRLKSLHHQSLVAPRTMIAVDVQELYDRAGNELNTTGTPCYYAEVGRTAQWQRLSADAALTVSCPVTTNNSNKTVRVMFRQQSSYTSETQFQDVTGTFSAGVSLANGVTFESGWPIESVYLPVGWVGNFQVTGNSQTLVDIGPNVLPASSNTEMSKPYNRKLIRVWPVPSTDYSLTITWKHMPRRLVQEGDLIEAPISVYLIEAAAAEILTIMGLVQKAAIHAAMAEQARESSKNQNMQAASRSFRPKYRNMLGTFDVPLW